MRYPQPATRHPEPQATASASRRAVLTAAGLLATLNPRAAPAESPLQFVPLQTAGVGRGALNAVERSYSTTFAAYLSRFLINWEPVTGRWWEQQNAIADSFDME